MFVHLKEDYHCPVCQRLELATESFICNSINPPTMEAGLEPMEEDPYTWML